VNTGYATIVTPISGKEYAQALKHFLRTEVEPLFDRGEPGEILKCRPRFPFNRIGSLHFCSFAVLDGDPEFRPCLVFEATFDGSLNCFLEALLHVAPDAIDEIYRHCEGYPASGRAIPELVKQYLAHHDEGAQAIYLGSPGRTVAQIKGEAQIYDALANSVCRPWSRDKAMPATFAGVLQELRDVILNVPGNRWAQQTAAVPWEVSLRKAVAWALVPAVLGTACLLGWLAVLGVLCGLNAGTSCAGDVITLLFSPHQRVRDLIVHLHSETFYLWYLWLVVLIALWAGLRIVESALGLLFEDRGQQSLWLCASVLILSILRYFFIVIFVVYSIWGLEVDWQLSLWQAIAMLIGAGVVFLLFKHGATSLNLAAQFKELEPAQEARKRLLADVLRVGMVVVGAFALVVLTRSVFLEAQFRKQLGTIFFEIPAALLELAVYAFVGVMVAYGIGCLFVVLLRNKERIEAKRFSGAEGLAAFDNSGVYAREEGGINTYQNHLVSLTYVKPGLLRALCLRLTLFVIGLLSRFCYNKGTLGGIPTILSARWVLIDGGRRLLFLDNYSGAWNSYLNEFIDMTAVFGLNAIWTNTFIKARGSQYAFPETEYYLWKGAQAERPFKAYVRHSQIETIVWYSAYPTVSTVNVNTNTEVRRSLFMPPVSCEIDSLLQNL
jgi:hypothetical protein